MTWPEVRLSRVARTISGSGFPPSEQGLSEGDLPFVKVSDVAATGEAGVVSAANWVTTATARALGARLIPPGATLFPKVGAALMNNNRAFVRVPCVADNNVMAVVPSEGFARYWYWVLRSLDMTPLSAGGALPFVSDSDVRALPVPLPPADEQRRIADFLDDQVAVLDRTIELRQRQMTLEEQRWDADLSEVYEGGVREGGAIRLGFLLRGLEQGWSPQCEDRPADTGEYGVLKAGCVNGGVFRPDQHKALPRDLVARVEFLVRPGDLLVSRASGSLDLIGSAAVIPAAAPQNLILCDKVYRLRLLPENDPQFVSFMMASRPLREAIKLGTSGAEGMANNLPSGTVRGLRIPAIPFSRQRVLRDLLVAGEKKRATARGLMARSIGLLDERKQALITAAVTGEFDVTTSGRVA